MQIKKQDQKLVLRDALVCTLDTFAIYIIDIVDISDIVDFVEMLKC